MSDAAFSHEMSRWAREAAFIFSGRVDSLNASNLEGVEPDDRMVTVDVEDVALAPRDLGDLRGQRITVYVEQPEGLKKGQTATFFARSWHYGRTLGVVEVGRSAAPVAQLRGEVVAARLRQLDEQVEARMKGAEVILSGAVVETYRAERTDGLPGVYEGVEWWNARMWIATVEKGRPPYDDRIWFPQGGDRDWGPIPKAFPGQTGVWFLRPVEDLEEKEGRSRRGEKQAGTQLERRLMAIDPLDYHASSDLPRIQALLWGMAEG